MKNGHILIKFVHSDLVVNSDIERSIWNLVLNLCLEFLQHQVDLLGIFAKIDPIYINQDDKIEKARQVSRITDIYRAA